MRDASATPCRCCAGAPHPHGVVPGRRAMLAAAAAALAMPAMGGGQLALAADPVPRTTLTPDQALALLKEGNARFVAGEPFSGPKGLERRAELARGQAPFCVVVGCSDSRVAPELLFDRGLGELFIVRNAGNIADTAALGSVEYGVGVLGCPLVVVLGHEGCGAVAAALEVVERDATLPGVIGEMIQPIIPAALAVRDQPGRALDNAVAANARRVAARLKARSPILQEALGAKRLKVVAARYRLRDGSVAWLEEA